MQLLLQYSYAAWWEHEVVLDLLQSAQLIAGRDSEDEIEDLLGGETFRSNPGSDRTKEELLDDVSRNRLWGYFDKAVEDAFSLVERRPSEVRRLRRKAAWQAAEEKERGFISSDDERDSATD